MFTNGPAGEACGSGDRTARGWAPVSADVALHVDASTLAAVEAVCGKPADDGMPITVSRTIRLAVVCGLWCGGMMACGGGGKDEPTGPANVADRVTVVVEVEEPDLEISTAAVQVDDEPRETQIELWNAGTGHHVPPLRPRLKIDISYR